MKLLFSDIDGTLLNKEKTISPALRDGILSFIKSGNKFILCSGRPEKSILQVKSDLRLPDKDLYISSCNGARLYDCKKKHIISELGIPLPMVRKILDTAYSFQLHCHTYDDDSILSEFQTLELVYYTHHVKIPVHIISDITTYLQKRPLKMLSICMDEHTPFPAFQKAITDISNGTLTSLLSNPSYLEIYPKNAGKDSSVKKLIDYLSVPIEDTISIGDAENDISMIQTAHLGVAMQNANDLTKSHADYITLKDNNHDGLLEILSRYTN
jgi:Cof subfamily protein (haloacid dehalogenase superfamily)